MLSNYVCWLCCVFGVLLQNTHWARDCRYVPPDTYPTQQGCRFVNKDGFCYMAKGQEYCKATPADPRCFTHDDSKPPKQW